MKIPTKELELWLLGWSESHSGGCKVTFQVTEEDLVYFRNATVRKGKHAGQRYAAVLVQLTDDDQPDPASVVTPEQQAIAAPPPPAPKPAAHHKFPGGYCGLAVRWCEDEEFRSWLIECYPEDFEVATETCNPKLRSFPVDVAATMVKLICGVETRTDLDTDRAAGDTFETEIRGPYMAYMEESKADS